VINEEPSTYLGPGVDLDPGQKPIDVGEKAAQEEKLMLPQEVSCPMQPDSVQARIAEEHLPNSLGCRILIENGLDILFNRHEHPIPPPP
jgi:hypothetical protein